MAHRHPIDVVEKLDPPSPGAPTQRGLGGTGPPTPEEPRHRPTRHPLETSGEHLGLIKPSLAPAGGSKRNGNQNGTFPRNDPTRRRLHGGPHEGR